MNHRALVSVVRRAARRDRGHVRSPPRAGQPRPRAVAGPAGESATARRQQRRGRCPARRTASRICRASGRTPPTRRSSGPTNVTKEFYTEEEVRRRCQGGGGARSRADRARHHRRRALRLHAVRAGPEPVGLRRGRPAHVADRRSAEREDSSADGRGTEAGRRPRRRARERMGATTDAVQNMPLGTRCLIMAGSGPPMMNAGYNNNYQIVQGPGYVMILVEMIHDVRIIPLDGRPPLPRERPPVDGRLARPLGGRHAGRRDDEFQRQESVPRIQREHAHDRALHARGRGHAPLQFTVDDPATWTTPWTAEAPMTKTVGPIFEHACHEGQLRLE